MNIFYSPEFKNCYCSLPQRIQGLIDKKLAIFLQNPRHPSLNIKKMAGQKDIWEARITQSYRFTFQIENDVYILRKVGTHDILKRP